MEIKLCQSCGMPLTNEVLGTNADGTMEQMIDHCARFTDEINRNSGQNLTAEQMKAQMRQFFPHLKRWKN